MLLAILFRKTETMKIETLVHTPEKLEPHQE